MREQLREPQATEAAKRLCVTHDRHWAVGIRPAFVMSGQGGGSFTADGTMIDIPVIDRAHRLQARRDRALVQEGLGVNELAGRPRLDVGQVGDGAHHLGRDAGIEPLQQNRLAVGEPHGIAVGVG